MTLKNRQAPSDVAAAARFGARIVDAPPGDQQRDEEKPHDQVGRGRRKVGNDVELRGHPRVGQQPLETAELRQPEDEARGPDGPDHGDDELDQIGEEHTGEPSRHAVGEGHHRGERACDGLRPSRGAC